MRFDEQVVYPYPILRQGGYDYRSSEFFGNIQYLAPTDEDDTLTISAAYTLSDAALQALVAEGKAAVRIQIKCRDTLLNRQIDLEPDLTVVKLKPNEIQGKISIHMVLVATQQIEGFVSCDFAEDFEGMAFDIPLAGILGFCPERSLYVDREAFGSAESVIEIVQGDSPDNVWKLETERNLLSIIVNKQMMTNITTLRAYPHGRDILMASLYTAVIQQAVEYLKRDGGDELLWQRVFRQRCTIDDIDLERIESGEVTQLLLRMPLKAIFEHKEYSNAD